MQQAGSYPETCLTGALRTTPPLALEIIVALRPLSVHIKQEAMLSCYRMIVNGQLKQTCCGHTGIKSSLMAHAPLSQMRSDETLYSEHTQQIGLGKSVLKHQMISSVLPMDLDIEDRTSLQLVFISRLRIKNKFYHLANTVQCFKRRCTLS